MKTAVIVLFSCVLLSVLISCDAQRRRGRSESGEGGEGPMACLSYVKKIALDGEEFSMAALKNIPGRLMSIAMKLISPGNPCSNIVQSLLNFIKSILGPLGMDINKIMGMFGK